MKPKILIECPLIPELFEAYLTNDGLDIERQNEDGDVPEESSNEVLHDTMGAYADELDNLLNEYLEIYNPEAPECRTVIDDEDQVAQVVDQIISEIVELLPDAKVVRINAETFNSIFVYCESNDEEEEEEDGSDS